MKCLHCSEEMELIIADEASGNPYALQQFNCKHCDYARFTLNESFIKDYSIGAGFQIIRYNYLNETRFIVKDGSHTANRVLTDAEVRRLYRSPHSVKRLFVLL